MTGPERQGARPGRRFCAWLGLRAFLWRGILWLPRVLAAGLLEDLLVLLCLKWRPASGDARWRWDRPRADPAAAAWRRYLRFRPGQADESLHDVELRCDRCGHETLATEGRWVPRCGPCGGTRCVVVVHDHVLTHDEATDARKTDDDD